MTSQTENVSLVSSGVHRQSFRSVHKTADSLVSSHLAHFDRFLSFIHIFITEMQECMSMITRQLHVFFCFLKDILHKKILVTKTGVSETANF